MVYNKTHMISNFTDANTILAKFVPMKRIGAYKLDRIKKLMTDLGNPQEKVKVIHVAGTAGKTSTCYYIANLLHLSGLKVGLTVSPHIDAVNERVQIDGVPLAEKEFCNLLDEFLHLPAIKKHDPTYFELMIAFAFWVFDKKRVEYAVVEVGLGGLLDGTNVVTRPDKVCVITDLGLDHTNILGDSIEEITIQKAGIIQQGNTVFTFEKDKKVLGLIQDRARKMKAELNVLQYEKQIDKKLLPIQQKNWQLAYKVFEFIVNRDGLPMLNDKLLEQSKEIVIPGRVEIRKYRGKTVILDGAHNPAKFEAIAQNLEALLGDKKVTVLIGMLDTKEAFVKECLEIILPFADSVVCSGFATSQDFPHKSLDPNLLGDACKDAGFVNYKIVDDVEDALEEALKQKNDTVLVVGSLYLVSCIRVLL